MAVNPSSETNIIAVFSIPELFWYLAEFCGAPAAANLLVTCKGIFVPNAPAWPTVKHSLYWQSKVTTVTIDLSPFIVTDRATGAVSLFGIHYRDLFCNDEFDTVCKLVNKNLALLHFVPNTECLYKIDYKSSKYPLYQYYMYDRHEHALVHVNFQNKAARNMLFPYMQPDACDMFFNYKLMVITNDTMRKMIMQFTTDLPVGMSVFGWFGAVYFDKTSKIKWRGKELQVMYSGRYLMESILPYIIDRCVDEQREDAEDGEDEQREDGEDA